MPFDFKKEYRELYMPKSKPQLVEVPPMNYIAVRGTATRTRTAVHISRPSAYCMPWPTR